MIDAFRVTTTVNTHAAQTDMISATSEIEAYYKAITVRAIEADVPLSAVAVTSCTPCTAATHLARADAALRSELVRTLIDIHAAYRRTLGVIAHETAWTGHAA